MLNMFFLRKTEKQKLSDQLRFGIKKNDFLVFPRKVLFLLVLPR